jgi:hypothetical protein
MEVSYPYAVLEPVNNKQIAKKIFSGSSEIRHNPELVDLFPVELLQELVRCMRNIL